MRKTSHFLIAGLLLALYIGLLMAGTYYAQSELRNAATQEMRLNLEQRAASLSYFLSERQEDLKTLQAHPAIQAFFANQALGMSMKYGLRASLMKIEDIFRVTIDNKRIADGAIFDRLALLVHQRLLADSDPHSHNSETIPQTDWPRVNGPRSVLYFAETHRPRDILMKEAVFHQGRKIALLVAWLNLEQAFKTLVDSEYANGNSRIVLARDDSILAASASLAAPTIERGLAHFLANRGAPADQASSAPLPHSVTLSVDVPNTTLRLYGIFPLNAVLGYVTSHGFSLALTALSILVIAGVMFLFKVSADHRVLNARISDGQIQRDRLNEQNQRLEREIAKRKCYEERLIKQANFDDLTGLPNRHLAMDRISQSIRMSERDANGFALMFLDLDRFKNVNDTLGHEAGDTLLTHAARRISKAIRSTDTVARLGGDEFLVLFGNLQSDQQAIGIAEKILERFQAPFPIDDSEVFVTLSIGISLYPSDGADRQTLLKNADMALHDIKGDGKNGFRFFDAKFDDQAKQRLIIESELLGGLERNELQIVFQPMMDLASGTCVGSEALLRWNNRRLGQVSPAKFIPIAEDTGLIDPIGEWVLRSACREAARWQRLRPLIIAVNVSSRQLRSPERFYRQVTSALEASGLPPRQLELEITEGLLLEEAPATRDLLERVSKLGVRLSVDDFGTGYSSLSYLKKFPFDRLKIDQSFVRDVLSDPEDAELVTAIIAMAKALHLEVLGEGIEREEQARFLLDNGCPHGQGYLFARPLPPEQLLQLMLERKAGTRTEAKPGT